MPRQAWADCTILCSAGSAIEAKEDGNVDGDVDLDTQCDRITSFPKYCAVPRLLGVDYTLDDLFCDPYGSVPCAFTAESRWHFPGNGSSACTPGVSVNAGWLLDPSQCGLTTGGTLDTDLGTVWAHLSATCRTPGSLVLRAIVCQGIEGCHKETPLPLDVSTSAVCNPMPSGCGGGDAGPGMCCFGPGGASAPDGSPPGFPLPDTNARLVYQAGGVGHPGAPGSATWIADSGLGRYWIHEFATRVVSPAATTAWLITPGGTFHRFTDTTGDGAYDEIAPSDEYRTLEHDVPASGEWTLTGLDGTVTVFNADGSWRSTSDRLGNAWTGSYVAGLLDTVSFPDGRQEVFSYVAGRLSTLQQIGLEDDGTPADCSAADECRTWTFTWAGDDLERLAYPDGTERLFVYDDARFPGYMTRRELIPAGGDDSDGRVEAAWEYTAGGRIHRTWRGADSFTDPAAVDTYEYTSYDDESLPTSVEVTDPFGQTATYEIGHDSASLQPRLESVAGQCPSCGGPDDRYEYDDASHPLRPTARIDGNGHRTELTYNANGTVDTRTEAASTPSKTRLITYDYDATFPGLRTLEQRASTSGSGFRETTWAYDATSGVLEAMTISGSEDTYDADGDGVPEGVFSLTTDYTGHNAAGQPGEVDPPGHGTADVTTWTYDVPGRQGLLPDSRTDPLVGPTLFGYDGLNRRTTVVDPNGVATETLYDPLDRVELVTRAAGTAEALVTDYRYDDYGDLEMVVHPRGNATVYGYDAAGRLTEVRRQAGETLAAGDERVLYTLDGIGHRQREAQQVYDGAMWQTASATEYEYTSRCYLDRVIHDPDDGATEVTEYAYDCDRKLTAVWDAKHPSVLPGGAPAPPTQVYAYDALDRLIELRQPWVPGTDCRGLTAPSDCAVTSYDYDVQDHLAVVTDANGNATTYTTSDRDLLTFEGSPVSGTTDHRYDDHGALVETTDGRGVTVHRTVDVLDRVTLVDYPGTTPDVTYVYDAAPTACPLGSSFPLGRLASITRNTETVDYCYDRFGRRTRDGTLTTTYDANGNLATMTYPGGVEASYTYDLVGDRATGLSVDTGSGPQPVASDGTYLPAGPLTGLTLGNGATETRGFDERYLPESIAWTGATSRSWTYATDPVGNVTSIEATTACAGDVTLSNGSLSGQQTVDSCADLILGPDLDLTSTADVSFRAAGAVRFQTGFSVAAGGAMSVETGATVEPPTELRTFDYRDVFYFLTLADGPWGERDWTYDPIGNRLTETRNRSGTPETDTYDYEAGAGGDTARLDLIDLSPTGTADYAWDDAGNLETLDRGANHLAFTFDAASRLSAIDRGDGMTVADSAVFTYDGRSFLRQATDPATGATVEPLYDSSGLLHALAEKDTPASPERRHTLFYLAGRPVAQLTQDDGTDTWQYLTTDHLGTPVLASDGAGQVTWTGGFQPFGHDYQEGTAQAALAADIFLRLPGQWETDLWAGAALGTGGVYYNVYRWYQPGTGRYTRPDPLGEIRPAREGLFTSNHPFAYGANAPTFFLDPLGLVVVVENPETRENYDQMKDCFPLFRNIAEHFENDTWTDFGPDRTWTIKDPDWHRGSCGVGGRPSETRTIWVPPGRDCEGMMRCLFHEFYELWLIRAGGFDQFGPAGPAHDRAKRGEQWIPFDKCCPCDAGGSPR